MISSALRPRPRHASRCRREWPQPSGFPVDCQCLVERGIIPFMLKSILAFFMACGLCLCACSLAFGAAPIRAAVFDFEWIDSSLEGEMNGLRADEQARLRELGVRLRRALAESGFYEIVDIAPKAAEAHAHNLQACGGCDADFARELGAQFSITGTVQKVSTLILNVTIYARNAATGRLVAVAGADTLGNTDESWFRTLDFIVRNRILAGQSK
jgi:hypothetical protein